ncbi:MAG: fumarate reductase/succinate dehydrogenase flavoprotein subunit, partial [Candidatus Dadabacteria bacterium]|nr:fumarate reductase/succinate dehydrogenase flavoprotein subunit [Candidatus Dadabacteria bacterium]
RLHRLLDINGGKTVAEFHRELGQIMWDHVGMSRNREGLLKASEAIRRLRDEYWQNVKVPGRNDTLNKNLEFAGRVGDFMELGELMARDALDREESCGGHFREEHQSSEGEAERNDDDFTFVSAWEYLDSGHKLHKDDLTFEYVELTTRSYK